MSNLALALLLAVVGLVVLVLASGIWDTVAVVLLVLAAVFAVVALTRGDRTL